MMSAEYGPGDPATWGPVLDPRDPRYTDPTGARCETVLSHLDWAGKFLTEAREAARHYRLDDAQQAIRKAICELEEVTDHEI